MKRPLIKSAEQLAILLGIPPIYVEGLPPQLGGFLDDSNPPKYIVVNNQLPAEEKVFTIAHEIGHWKLHFCEKTQTMFPDSLQRNWKSPLMRDLMQEYRDQIDARCDRETQADLYAFILLFHTGETRVTLKITEWHPEKRKAFYFALFCAFGHSITLILAHPIKFIQAVIQKG